jgi:K(+)-stimulated pyrophosphate-energized sodium pump
MCSSVAGFIGMYAATKANVRTATAAQKDGPAAALTVAFYGGSIMGLCVASLGLIGSRGLILFSIYQLESILINLKVLRWEHLL